MTPVAASPTMAAAQCLLCQGGTGELPRINAHSNSHRARAGPRARSGRHTHLHRSIHDTGEVKVSHGVRGGQGGGEGESGGGGLT